MMKILAIDTSGMPASVAVCTEETLLAEYTVHLKRTHSQTLMPMMEEIRRTLELDLNTVDAIAVAGGPGSFTGLRIGSGTAKGIGHALGIPLVPVPTLAALACNICGTDSFICPMIDARRQTVYSALYQWENGELKEFLPPKARAVKELLAGLSTFHGEVVFLGDGADSYRDEILLDAGDFCRFVPAHLNRPRAASVAILGMKKYERGECVPASEFRPVYLRLTQAEREKLERQKAKEESEQ